MRSITIKPIGSTECHGHHAKTGERLLPKKTDSFLAKAFARLAAQLIYEADIPVRVLETEEIGMSEEHTACQREGCRNNMEWKDNVTYLADMRRKFDLIAEEHPGSLIVALNAHGGNKSTLGSIQGQFNYRHKDTKLFIPDVYSTSMQKESKRLLGEFDDHAGVTEASMLACGEETKHLVAHIEPHQDEGYVQKFEGNNFIYFRTHELHPYGVVKKSPNYFVDAENGKLLRDFVVREIAGTALNCLNEVNQRMKLIRGS